MNIKRYTDPITGIDFKGLTDNKGNITVDTAFNGPAVLQYNEVDGTYTVPSHLLQYRPTMTLNQCAEYLGVSRVRVSRMSSNGSLKSVKIRGSLVIDAASAEAAKNERD